MTRTQWTVVIGLMMTILALFGVLLLRLQVPDPAPTTPPPAFLLEDQARARNALPAAQQEAARWQPDAQLASAEIVWDDLGPGGILKQDRWTFQFYSPSKQRMALVRVSDGQAQMFQEGLVVDRLPALPLDQWQVDSPEALNSWWKHGGARFVRTHAQSQVSISLKIRTDPAGSTSTDPAGSTGMELGGTRPVWIIVGSASGEHWIVQLDARDGSVLEL
jgi:hypothetical protein